MKKTVLITGANRGIGFEIALQTGMRGFRVFISGRDQDRMKEASEMLRKEGIDAEILMMDIGDRGSIRKASSDFSAYRTSLDVLINNAGILMENDDSILNDPEWILGNTVQVNSYGALFVVREFLPFMNRPGRIINISSGGGSMTDPIGGWAPAYCVSKTILNALTRHLAFELKDQKIAVNAVCPGWVRTDMGGKYAFRPVEKGAETPVWLAMEAPDRLTGKIFRDKKEIPW
jgi:NAD(P)-dependent dehydrogenase (short-subunit alcohol dehydrogenase family)